MGNNNNRNPYTYRGQNQSRSSSGRNGNQINYESRTGSNSGSRPVQNQSKNNSGSRPVQNQSKNNSGKKPNTASNQAKNSTGKRPNTAPNQARNAANSRPASNQTRNNAANSRPAPQRQANGGRPVTKGKTVVSTKQTKPVGAIDWNGIYGSVKTAVGSAAGKAADASRRFWEKKKLRNTVIAIVAVIALLGIGGTIAVNRVLGKIDFVDEEQMIVPEDISEVVLDDIEVVSDADTITDEQVEEMDKEISAAVVGEDGLISQEGVTNVLVLGIDTRKNHQIDKTRSDVMIILSINENTKQIVMSSLMRDIYVSIPGRRYPEKLTHAHAYGGPTLTKETIEGAFGIKIDHFVMVNFYAFMDVVDALGGIELSIDESERKVMNTYVAQINRLNGLPEDSGKLYETGENLLLTGKQTLGYVRNRYSGNGDYERTQRQREVLAKIINKAKTASAGQLLDLVDAATGNMSTDYSKMEIVALAAEAINYKDYEIVQTRIPVEGTFTTGIKNGVWRMDINFKKNREALYKAVFGEWYTGSEAAAQ